MKRSTLGTILHSFFLEHLPQEKGLKPTSIRSYRDTMRLFLNFLSTRTRRGVSMLDLGDLGFEGVLAFLHELELTRGNGVSTRNQRLAAMHTFFEFVCRQAPEMLDVCGQVAAIPMKRCALPDTRFIVRDDVQALFDQIPSVGALALRDRALLLFLYNTGARVSEVADLCVTQLELNEQPQVRLFGKGGKWRTVPLWEQTAGVLRDLIATSSRREYEGDARVFTSGNGRPMTRFGIYKRVRLHAATIEGKSTATHVRHITPHVFRHTTAVHLLEAGVEVNVIRSWLGHVNLNTTNRYAEITLRMKAEALRLCEPPTSAARAPRKVTWHDDASLMSWLSSL